MRRIVAFLRRNGWLLLIGAILEGLVGYQVVRSVSPTFQATALVSVNAAAMTPNAADAQTTALLVRSAVEAMQTRPVLEQAAAAAGLEPNAADLEQRVSVSHVRDTRILRVSAEDSDPQRAAALANAVPRVYSERVAGSTAADLARRRANLERLSQQQRLETDAAARRVQELQAQPPDPAHEADLVNLRNQAALLEASYTSTLRNYQDVLSLELLAVRDGVEVLEQAIPPLRPIRPSYAILTLLAVIAGTALATALAVAREYLDDTLADAERVRLRLDLPTLGTVSSAGADYELLAGRCRALLPDRLIPSAVVAGATAVERSAIVAVNLAIALAHFGHQVLLVDVDSPETSAARNLGAADDKRTANGHVADVPGYTLNTTQVPGLSVLVSATPNNDESALALKAQLEQLPWDTVVLDAPAVLDRPHAAVIASYVDFAVLVVDPRRSSARATDRAVRNLRAVGAQILGVVLNLHPETVLERKPASDKGDVDAMRRKPDRPRARVPLGDEAP